MPPQYTLRFVNQSANSGTACLYQTSRSFATLGNAYSVAWLTAPSAPQTMTQFSWEMNFGFAWARTGAAAPGVIFKPAEYLDADLETSNQVTLADRNGVGFENQQQGPQSGTLFVRQDETVPQNSISVGFGLSGKPAFAVQARPNMTVTFDPQIQYWIIFGTFRQGELLNTRLFEANLQSEFTQPARIIFPPDVFGMTAVLNPDNSWTIERT